MSDGAVAVADFDGDLDVAVLDLVAAGELAAGQRQVEVVPDVRGKDHVREPQPTSQRHLGQMRVLLKCGGGEERGGGWSELSALWWSAEQWGNSWVAARQKKEVTDWAPQCSTIELDKVKLSIMF